MTTTKNPSQILRRALAYWLQRDAETLSPEERQACEAYLERRDAGYTRAVALVVFGFHLVAPWLELAWARPEALTVLLGTHTVALALIGLWFTVANRAFPAKPLFAWAIQLLTLGVYAHLLHERLMEPLPFSLQTFIGWTIIVAVTFYSTLLAPSQRSTGMMAAVGFATTVYVWWPLPEARSLIAINTIALIYATILRRTITMRVWKEARFEYAAVTSTVAAEQARVSRDRERAREVQDSMLPPPTLRLGAFEAHFHLRRHASIGGDWFAVRTLKDGRSIVLICDSAGKGVRAAIVLHAVQSLWAEALGQDEFDAAAWLARVNLCLLRMGRKERHAATLGLAIVGPAEVTYWSAGHLPLFVVRRDTGKDTVQRLAPRGDMLGVDDDFRILPVTQELPPGFTGDLLLVTDGVMAGGTRMAPETIIRLVDDVATRGDEAVDAIDIADDKAVILLRHAG